MSKITFNTVATELVEHAEAALAYFRGLGYKAYVEPLEIHFPARPTFVFRRSPTALAVLVTGKIDMRLLQEWVSLAKSMSTDFRVALCLPHESSQKQLAKNQLELQRLGVGVFVSAGGQLTKLTDAVDQNINVTLPDLARQPNAVRHALGPAYEHFRGGRWRDCFEEACTSLEQEVRPYFKKAIRTGRLTVYDSNGNPKNPTLRRIDSMTIGQLAVALGSARPLNGTDSQLQKALTQINSDRVGAAHKNRQAATERRLRKNVGVHMHAIVQAIRELKR
jgi:hypothetical protein